MTKNTLKAQENARQPRTKRRWKKKMAFLRAFRDNGSVTASALLAGVDGAVHYDWLATDAKYKAAFDAAMPQALGALEDDLIRLARIGHFEPIIYKGEFQYATRKRTMCTLADGTTAFEDELPKGGRVTGRRTVTTRDGEMLGVYRRDARLLMALVEAWRTEECDASPQVIDKNGCLDDPNPARLLMALVEAWRPEGRW